VHLGSEYKNKTVSLYGDPYGGDQGKRLLKTGTVNSSGNLSVSETLWRNWTFSAVYAGDDRTAPRTVSTTTYTYTSISEALSGQYKTVKQGSTPYAYYHKNANTYVTVNVPYFKGRGVRFDLEIYYDGRWNSPDSFYEPVGTNGKVKVNLGSAGAAGYTFRVRAVYVQGTSGDNHNATTYTGWKYLHSTN
jgi:hypothetical protein